MECTAAGGRRLVVALGVQGLVLAAVAGVLSVVTVVLGGWGGGSSLAPGWEASG